jgi:hypothetical protein
LVALAKVSDLMGPFRLSPASVPFGMEAQLVPKLVEIHGLMEPKATTSDGVPLTGVPAIGA